MRVFGRWVSARRGRREIAWVRYGIGERRDLRNIGFEHPAIDGAGKANAIEHLLGLSRVLEVLRQIAVAFVDVLSAMFRR